MQSKCLAYPELWRLRSVQDDFEFTFKRSSGITSSILSNGNVYAMRAHISIALPASCVI